MGERAGAGSACRTWGTHAVAGRDRPEMTRRLLLLAGVLCSLLLFHAARVAAQRGKGDRPPNVVLIFADDLGYGDLGCYGARGFRTPNIDRMAARGRPLHRLLRRPGRLLRLARRAADRLLLQPRRHPRRPRARRPSIGINADETTIAEVLKPQGYATAIYGKWHLGHQPPSSCPTRHGFDDYFGLPYSNDMWPKHPTNPTLPDLPADRRRARSSSSTPTRRSSPPGTPSGPSASSSRTGPALLPLRAAQHAARPAVRLGEVRGQVGAGASTAT